MYQKFSFFALACNLLYFDAQCRELSMTVMNQEVVEGRMHGSPLYVRFETLDFEANSSCKACLDLNGVQCHCFMHTDNIFLPSTCTSPSNFWLSGRLVCGAVSISSAPIFVPFQATPEIYSQKVEKVTFVLPLDLGDLSRYVILLRSLSVQYSPTIHSLIVVVPDEQHRAISLATVGFEKHICFPVVVMNQSALIPDSITANSYPYAVQMAIKILIAQIVTTEFYITLDSDVVLLRNFEFCDIIHNGQGIYHHESRFEAHPEWWHNTEVFVGIQSANPGYQGIGVTPAVLSTIGSIFVLKFLQNRFGESFLAHWLTTFGSLSVWSEYTLYRIVLDHFNVSYFLRNNLTYLKLLLCF
jgi:hypothetical protein